jgi:phosphohistidine phosphatase SixA
LLRNGSDVVIATAPRHSAIHTLVALALLAAALAETSTVARAQSELAKPPAIPPLVILVRHADKAAAQANDHDPPLSEAGRTRAQDLAAALHDAGVTAIITTELRRSRETAAPLAQALALKPEVIPMEFPISRHVSALERAVRRHAEGVLLVVGHGNTIPELLATLGGPKLPEICDVVYDNLFTLFPKNGKLRFIHSRYGVPTPDTAPECRQWGCCRAEAPGYVKADFRACLSAFVKHELECAVLVARARRKALVIAHG